ncbi:MAG: ATP-binding cassette domain-containing protein, partial [Planctomycetota bacterium]|nr:ATP-binding cassette domain-containing protein [Planctomycetota bacterium]
MIDVHDLSFTYEKSTTHAVRGVDFTVDQGEIFGFLGPSGAGKSTTQKILIGLLERYEGQARIRNKDVASWSSDDYERIGVSFETPNHFLKL